jgi:hypothetical protein
MVVTSQVFACYEKACAPPPAGRGGSSKGGPTKRQLRKLSSSDLMEEGAPMFDKARRGDKSRGEMERRVRAVDEMRRRQWNIGSRSVSPKGKRNPGTDPSYDSRGVDRIQSIHDSVLGR